MFFQFSLDFLFAGFIYTLTVHSTPCQLSSPFAFSSDSLSFQVCVLSKLENTSLTVHSISCFCIILKGCMSLFCLPESSEASHRDKKPGRASEIRARRRCLPPGESFRKSPALIQAFPEQALPPVLLNNEKRSYRRTPPGQAASPIKPPRTQ